MRKEEARALARAEIQKRQPDVPENQKIEMAKIIAANSLGDPDEIVAAVATLFPDPDPTKPKEDSAT